MSTWSESWSRPSKRSWPSRGNGRSICGRRPGFSAWDGLPKRSKSGGSGRKNSSTPGASGKSRGKVSRTIQPRKGNTVMLAHHAGRFHLLTLAFGVWASSAWAATQDLDPEAEVDRLGCTDPGRGVRRDWRDEFFWRFLPWGRDPQSERRWSELAEHPRTVRRSHRAAPGNRGHRLNGGSPETNKHRACRRLLPRAR